MLELTSHTLTKGHNPRARAHQANKRGLYRPPARAYQSVVHPAHGTALPRISRQPLVKKLLKYSWLHNASGMHAKECHHRRRTRCEPKRPLWHRTRKQQPRVSIIPSIPAMRNACAEANPCMTSHGRCELRSELVPAGVPESSMDDSVAMLGLCKHYNPLAEASS